MVTRPPIRSSPPRAALGSGLRRWQAARTWARLIREAEALWFVDVQALHRLAARELMQLVQEMPPRLRRRVNQWLRRFRVLTRLQ
ncbi:MAG: hypothetical protein WAM11_13765 [Cyanobium sp.]